MSELRKNPEYGVLLAGAALLLAGAAIGLVAGLSVKLKSDTPAAFSPMPSVYAAAATAPSSMPVNHIVQPAGPVITKTDCTAFLQQFSGYYITGSYGEPGFPIYMFTDGGNTRIRSYQLEREGYDITPRGLCSIEIKKEACVTHIQCSVAIRAAIKPDDVKPSASPVQSIDK